MTTDLLSGTRSPSSWDRTRRDFLACHQDRRNVLIHLVTTPLGLWAVLSLAAKVDSSIPVIAVTASLLWMTRVLPVGVWWANAACFAGLLFASLETQTGALSLLVLLATAYAGQDLAHRITGEPTFEDGYRDSPDRLLRWAEHCLLLLPLVLVALTRARGSAIAWLRPLRSVLRARFEREVDRADLATLRRWVREQEAAPETSTHWWRADLPEEIGAAFDRIEASGTIEAALRDRHGEDAVILGAREMNEVYVAGPDRRATSDRVFFVPHIDGPVSVFPGATLYRCLVALTPNDRIATCFPLEGTSESADAIVLDEADVVAFDYHRTPHFIRERPGQEASAREDRRVTLKLHYAVAPAGLGVAARWLADLSTRYNARARTLFLDTLEPSSKRERASARAIVFQTHLWQQIARWAGHRNLAFLAVLTLISALSGTWIPFVAGASFVHYFLYIAVYGSRDDVSFGTFKRDAIFYKTVSMSILGVLYLAQQSFDAVSLMLIATGFGLSSLAATALGVDRTYFGAELGHCEPRRIERFPYGSVPHPMILGSIVGLVGIAWLEPFRAEWPWLVPIHVALYLCHLAQEMGVLQTRDQGRGDRLHGAT